MDEYKIKKEFTNSELSEMGYYCPKSSEKVYLTKEYYEKEMEEILNFFRLSDYKLEFQQEFYTHHILGNYFLKL